MGIIGIACNPQSGKDIRRLLTAATTIDDLEKTNIIERILLSVSAIGNHKVYIMPDRLGYGRLLQQKTNLPDYPGDLSQLEIYDMERRETQEDTIFFASEMERIQADVMIVMGGDGTSRAAAKGSRRVPMISLSTGTNNVYPELMEGTVAGVAAAVLADHAVPVAECVSQEKCIEIYVNGVFRDLALIDLVFCRNPFIGSKAIWNYEEIYRVMVTRCSMASIGFSAMIGSVMQINPEDNFGGMAEITDGKPNTYAPVGAGIVRGICVENAMRMEPENVFEYRMEEMGTLALDGEREIVYYPGDQIRCVLRRNGPLKVHAAKTIELARERGFFQL